MSDTQKKKVVKKKSSQKNQESKTVKMSKPANSSVDKVSNAIDDKKSAKEAKKAAKLEKKKNMTKKQRIIRTVVITLSVILGITLIAVGIVYAVFLYYFGKTNHEDDKVVSASYKSSESEMKEKYSSEKQNDVDGDLAADIFESMSKAAESSIAASIDESIQESIKQSLEEAVGNNAISDIAESIYESQKAEGGQMSLDEIIASIIADENAKNDIVSSAAAAASESISEAVASEASAAVSEAVSSANEEMLESLSSAAQAEASSQVGAADEIAESQSAEAQNYSMLQSSDVTNILLIGQDYETGRSDSMIILSINNSKGTIHLVSIMRDMYISLEGFGGTKINRAFQYGGGPMLVKVIEDNFRVKIDNYAYITINNAVSLFDSIGGLDITVSDEEAEGMNRLIRNICGHLGLKSKSYLLEKGGSYHMNGVQILAYCRLRYVGRADFERTERQRKVLTLLFNKLKASDIGTINDFLNGALPLVYHNMSAATATGHVLNALTYLSYGLDTSLRIPADGTYSNYGDNMLVTDFNGVYSQLKAALY